MKRYSNEPLQPEPNDELYGLIRLGMEREALRLARAILKKPIQSAGGFNQALDAIMTFVDSHKRWVRVVESAYQRLPQPDRAQVRHLMIAFYNGCSNYEAILNLLPRRFGGTYCLNELAFAIEAALNLGRMDAARKLASRMPRAIRDAENPIMQNHLSFCFAEYLSRAGQWGRAIKFFTKIQHDEIMSHNAVAGIVDIHVARALTAIKRGLRCQEEFKSQHDPELETTLPGIAQNIQSDAEKTLHRLQKLLEKVLPKERRKELGIDV